MKFRWLLALCWVFSVQYVRGEDITEADFDARVRQGIEYIYNLEFEKADLTFRELALSKPRHPAGHFFLAMVDWWRMMIDIENTLYDERFYKQLEKVVDLCDELLDENEADVTALFFKGGSLGFEGRLRFHRDDWLAAANAGRRALPLVQDAAAANPTNADILLGTGIYNYYAEVIPEQYPIAKPLLLFIPPGDRKKGIAQLRKAAAEGKYASIEAKYFLMQLHYLYEKQYGEALSIAQELHSRFPNNMLFHKYVGRCLVAQGSYDKAREVFEEVAGLVRQGKPGYNKNAERENEYYLGLCDLNARRYDDALAHFYRCDELSRRLDTDASSGYMVMSNLSIGKVYDVQLKRELAVAQYKKVLGMKEFRDSYTQSEKFLKTPFTH
jgi:tetratricopeptide (TPR) repeat protein